MTAPAAAPETEARCLQAERNLSSPRSQHAVCDGVHLVDDFVFVRITVTSDSPVDYRSLRSDLGDQLAEVIRANWPQGDASEPASRVTAGGNGSRRSFGGGGGAGGSHAPDVVVTVTGGSGPSSGTGTGPGGGSR